MHRMCSVVLHSRCLKRSTATRNTDTSCVAEGVGELLAEARAAMDLPALAPSDAVLMSDTSMQVKLQIPPLLGTGAGASHPPAL
jgi:hypothetical protein